MCNIWGMSEEIDGIISKMERVKGYLESLRYHSDPDVRLMANRAERTFENFEGDFREDIQQLEIALSKDKP